MAITELYVDPTLTDGTGAGTIGDPYGDIETCITAETFDTTNGTRINVKAGTPTGGLTAELYTSFSDTGTSVAWDTGNNATIIIQGYTTTAGDGGQGTISGGGSVSILNTLNATVAGLTFVDMHLTNSGAAALIVTTPVACTFLRCEMDTSSASTAIGCTDSTFFIGTYVHSMTGVHAINMQGGAVINCYINHTGSGFGNCLSNSNAAACVFMNNIIVSGTSSQYGINVNAGCIAMNNSVYSTVAGTNAGFLQNVGGGGAFIGNNLVEGWSGTGGSGIDVKANGTLMSWGNTGYNNTDGILVATGNTDIVDWKGVSGSGNEDAAASPFTSAGTDFSPVDTDNVREGSFPNDIADGSI